MNFTEWLKSDENQIVKIVAERWFRPDGSAKYRSMTQSMILSTMKEFKMNLEEAATVFEKALLFYGDHHVVGGPKAYWELVENMKKNEGIFIDDNKAEEGKSKFKNPPVLGPSTVKNPAVRGPSTIIKNGTSGGPGGTSGASAAPMQPMPTK